MLFKNHDPADEVLLSRPWDNCDCGMTVPPKFSDAMRELEDEHNMNMSVSSNKLKHLRVQESDGDKHDSISHGC